MKAYYLSEEAENDLDDIKTYLMEEGGEAPARYVLRELRRVIRFLAANPGAGHMREDLTKEPVKFWSIFSYLIVYDPATKPLGVARIVHGGQDLAALFRKQPPRV